MSIYDMMIILYGGLGAPLEARPFSKLLISRYYALCGKREMLEFLQISGGH